MNLDELIAELTEVRNERSAGGLPVRFQGGQGSPTDVAFEHNGSMKADDYEIVVYTGRY